MAMTDVIGILIVGVLLGIFIDEIGRFISHHCKFDTTQLQDNFREMRAKIETKFRKK